MWWYFKTFLSSSRLVFSFKDNQALEQTISWVALVWIFLHFKIRLFIKINGISTTLRHTSKQLLWLGPISAVFVNLTSGGLLRHAIISIQGEDGVLGQGLLSCVVGFSGATVVTEQVEVSLAWPWAGSGSCCCCSLCRGAGRVTRAHLVRGRKTLRFRKCVDVSGVCDDSTSTFRFTSLFATLMLQAPN